MARKQAEQEDPWAGFVDVLSNVVMVVTFIIILLGIAMLVLSQQVARSLAEAMIEEARQAGGTGSDSGSGLADGDGEHAPAAPAEPTAAIEPADAAPAEEASEAQATDAEASEAQSSDAEASEAQATDAEASDAQAADAEASEAQSSDAEASDAQATDAEASEAQASDAQASESQSEAAEADASSGQVRVVVDRPLLQPDEVDGDTELTVRSREADVDERVAITEEMAIPTGGEIVVSADAVVTVEYDVGTFDLPEETGADVSAAIAEIEAQGGADSEQQYEIVAIATSAQASISEARRLAFYRGMRLRSALLAAGVDASRIGVIIRDSDDPEDLDRAFVFLTPE